MGNVMRVVARGSLFGVIALLVGAGLVGGRPASAQTGIDFSQELVGVIDLGGVNFAFSQSGFSEGASVTGTFSGTDTNTNGQLSSFDGEVSAFAMAFSGNSLVPAFTLDSITGFFELVYDLDGGPLGDGTTGDIEGVAATDFVFLYAAGPGPFEVCGIGEDCGVVLVIPQPGTGWLCAMALVGLVGYGAWRRRPVTLAGR